MIICKRPVNSDYHLREAGPFRWLFARGRSIQMIICIWSLFVVCRWLLFVVGLRLSLVVVCYWSLFVVGRCLLLVLVCCWLLFVVDRCLSLVIVCLWSFFSIIYFSLSFWADAIKVLAFRHQLSLQHCLSLVVVCRWLLFVVGRCLSLVIVCCCSSLVVGRCLMLVVVCRWLAFWFLIGSLFIYQGSYFLILVSFTQIMSIQSACIQLWVILICVWLEITCTVIIHVCCEIMLPVYTIGKFSFLPMLTL